MKSLITTLSKKYSLNESSLSRLIEEMDTLYFQKGEYVVQEGERDSNLYIIKSGIWRAFRTNNGEEFALWFSSGSSISFQIWGYTKNAPSEVTIEAEIESEALVISKEKLDNLCQSSLEIANLVRNIFENHALGVENDLLLFVDNVGAEQRYLSMLSKYPELIKSIPLKKLASYLYITPQSLSRIRAGLKRPKKVK